MKTFVQAIFMVVCSLCLASCASQQQTLRYSEQEIEKLHQTLVDRPNDATVLRDLGVAYFQQKKYVDAKEFFFRSFVYDALDGRTVFYYGMTLEILGHVESALSIYVNYAAVESSSPYRQLIEGRYRILQREVIRTQLLASLAREKDFSIQKVAPKAVAVFPMTFQGTDDRYSPLSKGLSELILIDLGQVKGLTLIERIRTEELLSELKLSQSKFVDRASAPRLGKLIGAGKVVSGAYDVQNNELRLDGAAWDIVHNEYPVMTTQSDNIDNFFRVEKELVFSLIKNLGITLTAEERENIQRVPTRNFFAFMNFSLGLRSEDAYDYVAAGAYYKQAVAIDPAFEAARAKMLAMEAIAAAGSTKERTLLTAEMIEPAVPQFTGNSLIEGRLGHLGKGLGGTFEPGDDDRKSVEEAVRGGAHVGTLPEPPRPPQ